MKVFVKGSGAVTLTKTDFIFQGGEGSIYSKGNTAFKIYTDPKKMISTAKIGELSAIEDDKVIRPQNILLDEKNNPIGYSMRYLKDTHALCQVFTKAFRDRESITPDQMLNLVRGMQTTVTHIHSKRILIVDLNEMNFLVDRAFKEVYFIDVDSYQTKNFPATALMESVRDRHAKKFDEGTDWFAFAVVSFQMFIGIHPYKGKHPTLSTLDERMEKNVSVMSPGVSIPKVCQPFDVIPEVYKRWYLAVLNKGDRLAPPTDLHATIEVTHTVRMTVSSSKFDINLILSGDEPLLDYYVNAGVAVATYEHKYKINGFEKVRSAKNSKIAFTPRMNNVMEAWIENDLIHFQNLTVQGSSKDTASYIGATSLMVYKDRLYALSGSSLLEIQFSEMGQNVVIGSKVVCSVVERATQMFQGVIIQNLIGSYFASVFPEQGTSYQIKLPELESYRIVDAKFDSRVMILTAASKGKYDKFIFKFSRDFSSYELRVVRDISILDINFVMIEQAGIIASINEDENLELFSLGGSEIKAVESSAISSDMKLLKDGTRVLFARGNDLYSLKMK